MKQDWTPRRLEALMAAYDMDDVKLAARLTVIPQSVQNWLAGRNTPTKVHRRALERMEARLAQRAEKAKVDA